MIDIRSYEVYTVTMSIFESELEFKCANDVINCAMNLHAIANNIGKKYTIDESFTEIIPEYIHSVGDFTEDFIEYIKNRCDEYMCKLAIIRDDMLHKAYEVKKAEEISKLPWEEIEVYKSNKRFRDALYRRKSDEAEVRVISADVEDFGRFRVIYGHTDADDPYVPDYSYVPTDIERDCLDCLKHFRMFGYEC